MKIKEYELVSDIHLSDFNIKINRLINKGYELHGPMMMIQAVPRPYKESEVRYAQAMILLG